MKASKEKEQKTNLSLTLNIVTYILVRTFCMFLNLNPQSKEKSRIQLKKCNSNRDLSYLLNIATSILIWIFLYTSIHKCTNSQSNDKLGIN